MGNLGCVMRLVIWNEMCMIWLCATWKTCGNSSKDQKSDDEPDNEKDPNWGWVRDKFNWNRFHKHKFDPSVSQLPFGVQNLLQSIPSVSWSTATLSIPRKAVNSIKFIYNSKKIVRILWTLITTKQCRWVYIFIFESDVVLGYCFYENRFPLPGE